MYNPISTYRIQFHKDFTFTDFEQIIPYLHRLGVKTVYASPVFEATPGSTHGYDVVNPQCINPEIGTLEQLRTISGQLKELNMGWIQDIVPNHMAFATTNPWLMDVLEKGQLSAYASFFDLTWNSPVYHGRLMVPFLGSPLHEVVENGELHIAWQNDRFELIYHESAYPLQLRSYATILHACPEQASDAIRLLLEQIHQLQQVKDPDAWRAGFDEIKLQLMALHNDGATRVYIEACLHHINDQPELIKAIADEQLYRLCYHQETDYQINYRRFFTVNGLICLNIQHKPVFDATHTLIKQLVDEGVFQGLRVDHIDGLSDPTLYLENLRELAGDETYIVVEKILEPDEKLPSYWPIQGTTGYGYLSMVNNLFTRTKSETSFTRFYQQLLGEKIKIHQELNEKKAYILFEHMAGELDNLTDFFRELDLVPQDELAAVPADMLRQTIGRFLIQCPVYRYYGNRFPLGKPETTAVADLFARIRRHTPELEPGIALLEKAMLQQPLLNDADYNSRAVSFYQRCMQFTGPLMAKGMEDTLMYTYNRFIGHDEVGDSPTFFGLTVPEFHRLMADRQANWPLALNATSTHDTKRGEDVRSRLNVLTDLTDEWIRTVTEWQSLNEDLKTAWQSPDDPELTHAPDANDEYFIYQTLIGAHPMPEQDASDFAGRLEEYLEKALREAKRHSSWNEPNEAYEQAAKDFATGLLDKNRPFRQQFDRFRSKVADFGMAISLAQVLLKFTCPGTPDVYQGCEGWDLSLVDPDNRRPVDYELRNSDLSGLDTGGLSDGCDHLWACRYDARIKQWLIRQLLQERQTHPDLFAHGQYMPLTVTGTYKDQVIAFARRHKHTWVVVAVPLGLALLCEEQQTTLDALDWKDTRILLPDEAPAYWVSQLHQATGNTQEGIAVKAVFDSLPLALLHLPYVPKDRKAGVLMHITSLPSAFGIGDFGPEAYRFADALNRSHQAYWQILPLNPVEAGQGHSPYSSTSSMAGSPLLISPELLAAEGLLDPDDLKDYAQPVSDRVDFTEAGTRKAHLFEKAYRAFLSGHSGHRQRQFDAFCEQEASWLQDYALYATLTEHFGGKPWSLWPDEYKLRDVEALKAFAGKKADAIRKVKWLQFVFMQQWQQLRTYCHHRGIQFFGDLPFYVSYDSVDVWANREFFSIDENGAMTGVAGVPPDYFNADGQLWGMPVFRWDVLKNHRYGWWVERIRKNMELYDLLRLDHFRAFADYWEVPAHSNTAKNGQWKQGPGADFFLVMQQELGDLPFVAEDLGDINEGVYQLRDAFGMPGMRVVQFAFGADMADSVNIPHHYIPNAIAYTGTHDNNTTRGWFRKDATPSHLRRLNSYLGHEASEASVHLVLGRMVYASVARTAILPLQDILGLDETARMNTPASASGNWGWRLQPEQFSPEAEQLLRDLARTYSRW